MAKSYHDTVRKIIIDPDVCNGQPTFEGTRISVQTVLEFLAAGDSTEDILRAYPALSRDEILEALRLSSKILGHHFLIREVA